MYCLYILLLICVYSIVYDLELSTQTNRIYKTRFTILFDLQSIFICTIQINHCTNQTKYSIYTFFFGRILFFKN